MNKYMPLKVNSNAITEALGRDLTEDYSIVFAEQLKNAKDAGAKNVTIDISHFDQEILIQDDGKGTDFNDVVDTWLTVGTTTKSSDINSLGGKGIGRLTMFALGDTISVETTNNFKKSIFKLDKKELANDEDFNSVTLNVSQVEDNKKQQTIIRITNIIVEYLDKDKIQKDLQNLFKDENDINFTILPTDQKKSTQNYIPVADGTKYATLHSNFVLDAKMLSVKHTAAVHLWDKKKDISDTSVKEINEYVLSNKDLFQRIGDVSFDVYHFYEPQNTKTPYALAKQFNKRDIQNRLLSYAGGINIYRKGTKLFGYGLSDWLGLEYESRNDSSKISNSRTLGTIILSPESEKYLVEKSNRESLKTSTKAYRIFKIFIEFCIKKINIERQQVKAGLWTLQDKITNLTTDLTTNPTTDLTTDLTTNPTTDLTTNPTTDSIINSKVRQNNENNNNEYEIGGSIVLKKSTEYIKLNHSYDMFSNIDLDKSMTCDGKKFCRRDLSFIIDGKENQDEYLRGQSLPSTKNIVVKDKIHTLSGAFDIIIMPKQRDSSRPGLFPLDEHGDHFKLEPSSDQNFLRIFMSQLNDIWITRKYDYVVTGSMRVIIDAQIDELNKSVNNASGKVIKMVPHLTGNFNDIKILLDLIFGNEDLKKQIAETLGYTNTNVKKNFWRKFEDPANRSNTGEYFKNKLQRSHTGAHKPQDATNPMEILGLADDQKNFLELSSAYLKVLESSKSSI